MKTLNAGQMTAMLMSLLLVSMVIMPGCSVSTAVSDLDALVAASEGIAAALPNLSPTDDVYQARQGARGRNA
jgi:hypothetical protein